MSYGDGSPEEWALDYDAATPFFRQALDLGITFWDTANIYKNCEAVSGFYPAC